MSRALRVRSQGAICEALDAVHVFYGGHVGIVGSVQQARRELHQAAAVDLVSNGRRAGFRSRGARAGALSTWNGRRPASSWAALGGFFAFIGFLTFFAALVDGKASTVVVLSALYPLVTIPISIAFLHERLTGRQDVGIVLALIASATTRD